jgi:hypothetical protein
MWDKFVEMYVKEAIWSNSSMPSLKKLQLYKEIKDEVIGWRFRKIFT